MKINLACANDIRTYFIQFELQKFDNLKFYEKFKDKKYNLMRYTKIKRKCKAVINLY